MPDGMPTGFVELSAAADFLGNGAIEVNRYEDEILDMVRRGSVLRSRIDGRPATGQPHRYFEQTAIATGSFTDPRNIAPTPSSPTRVERTAFIKGITAQTNLSLFDVDVTRMQGQFASVEGKDINDIIQAVINTCAPAYWTGTDTSLTTPTTIQYVGLFNQIALVATIGLGASIIDGIKTLIANMMAQTGFIVRPTGIYMNPLLLDYIEQEAKAEALKLDTTFVAGVEVTGVRTQAGTLPFITDVYIPTLTAAGYGFAAPATGKNYMFAILTENMIERPVVHGGDGNLEPRMFQLGLLAGLQGQYVAVQFDSILAKGATYAHAMGVVNRP